MYALRCLITAIIMLSTNTAGDARNTRRWLYLQLKRGTEKVAAYAATLKTDLFHVLKKTKFVFAV